MSCPTPAYDLLTVVFLHARTDPVCRHLQQLADVEELLGFRTEVWLVYDRPTPEVQTLIGEWRDHPVVASVIESHLPLRSPEKGEQFQQVRDWILRIVDSLDKQPEWVSFCDDDVVWGPGWEEKLAGCLNHETVQTWYARSLFLWGDGVVNLNQHHWSPHFFRFHPGDRMTPGVILHHPDRIQRWMAAEPAIAATLPFYLLDSGTIDKEGRRALFRECARCGKLDDYTRAYIQKPNLISLAHILRTKPDPALFEEWGQ